MIWMCFGGFRIQKLHFGASRQSLVLWSTLRFWTKSTLDFCPDEPRGVPESHGRPALAGHGRPAVLPTFGHLRINFFLRSTSHYKPRSTGRTLVEQSRSSRTSSSRASSQIRRVHGLPATHDCRAVPSNSASCDTRSTGRDPTRIRPGIYPKL